MLLPILCRLPLLPSVPGVLRAMISFSGSIWGRQPGALCTTGSPAGCFGWCIGSTPCNFGRPLPAVSAQSASPKSGSCCQNLVIPQREARRVQRRFRRKALRKQDPIFRWSATTCATAKNWKHRLPWGGRSTTKPVRPPVSISTGTSTLKTP